MSSRPLFHLRQIHPGDLEALLDLYRHLHPDDIAPAEPNLNRAWDDLLSNPGVFIFVGEEGGRLVASCTLVVVPNLTRGARPYAFLENVVTAAMARRRGYGSAVLRFAIEKAWELGCYKVMLLTGSAREEIIRFYEQAGLRSGLKHGLVAYPSRKG